MNHIKNMNPEIRSQWLADLRDGTRTQGTGRMRGNGGSQCCLDVLAEQAVKAGIIEAPTKSTNVAAGFVYYYFDKDGKERWEDSVLPLPVAQWAGLGLCTNPEVQWENREEHFDCEDDCHNTVLSEVNDSGEVDFPQIADLIEAEASRADKVTEE